MKFQCEPVLILTKDEFNILGSALKLCRDMDEQTDEPEIGCRMCPFDDDGCPQICEGCVYTKASLALKKILDIAVVK